MEVVVKLPKSKNDLRIKHLNVLMSLTESMDLNSQINAISKISGVSKAKLHTVMISDIKAMTIHLIGLFGKIKATDMPPEKVSINGIDYDRVDPDKTPIKYHIDYSVSDFEKDPVRLACMCYVPSGTKYGDIDENDNIIYPIASRWSEFNDHFPLELYIQMCAFFLRNYNRSILRLEAMEKGRVIAEKVINRIRFSGKPL